MKTYTLRQVTQRGYITSTLAVPQDIARLLTAAQRTTFTCELTEDGILFRPADPDMQPAARPSWLKGV